MIQTLIQYVLLAAGLAGSLALFLTIKREIHSHASRHRKRLEAMARRLDEASRETGPAYLPAAPRPGLNISKRVQAMRMVRRNEDISHIAAALGVTRKEVELLIRVQQMSKA